MSEHYFSQQTQTTSHEIKHTVHLKDMTLQLFTDHGVFSKTGLDFGSRLLIETVKSLSLEKGSVLDVGCGYGPIGISLSYLLSKEVFMVDINERAVQLAQKNILENKTNNCQAAVSDLYECVQKDDFALIVSNPPIRAGKQVVHRIIEEAKNHLCSNGKLVIVIQKKQGAPSAEKKMKEVFGNVDMLEREKGYWILASTNN